MREDEMTTTYPSPSQSLEPRQRTRRRSRPHLLRWGVPIVLFGLAGSVAAQTTGPSAAPAPAPTSQAPQPASPGNTPAAAAAPLWQPDDRLILSGDGDSLTGIHGTGGGGSLGFLAPVSPDTLLSVGGEYQSLAGSHWEFGSFTTAFSHALTSSTRWNISAEAHEGAGQSGHVHFGYGIEAGGLGITVPTGLTLSAEERQIDVDTSHGSLPKVGLAKAWGPHWLTSIGYAQSAGGNLATEYGVARLDFLSAPIQVFVGGDAGHVAPAVLDIEGVLLPQARRLTEVFVGFTKPTRRVDVSLLGDRMDLSGIVRLTVTLTATVHLR
jgi:hypothetical protein